MMDIPRTLDRLTLSGKVARLAGRLKDPAWRRYGAALLAGKVLGVALLLLAITGATRFLRSGQVFAIDPTTMPAATTVPSASQPASAPAAAATAAPPAAKADDPYVSPINTMWVMVAAFLVFGMQVGFTMLEAGFCRSRETVNVLVECVFDTCLCGVLFYAVGFAFMFGYGNGFIGWGDGKGGSWFFLKDATTTYIGSAGDTSVAFLAFWVFQYAFADTCSTITSGAMIGRTGFWGDIVYSCFVSGIIYPIIGHWAWGPDGFLATMGTPDHFLPSLGQSFHDFAGSTVVHTIGGMVALAGAIVLGPRLGRKFKRDGGGPMLPHDLTIAVSGGLLLWFGWYGFNPGSTLSAMDAAGCGRVAANTTLAACAGGLAAEFLVYFRVKKWDAGALTNGFLAGLVGITCPCYWVTPTGSLVVGAVAGVLAILATDLLEFLRIDDPIGAVPVHGVCGIWGTLSLGLFASGQFNSSGATGTTALTDATPALAGLFYHGGTGLLAAQAIGSAIVVASTFAVAMAVMAGIRALGILRISAEGETEGMDLHEHGISAYPEYVISASAAPAGMPAEAINAFARTAEPRAGIGAAPFGTK
ncbi:MAG: ammonium transporter [Phycisphaerales bacterium]|nr:ammonium transporter [Phycisphaerales bacterium]